MAGGLRGLTMSGSRSDGGGRAGAETGDRGLAPHGPQIYIKNLNFN